MLEGKGCQEELQPVGTLHAEKAQTGQGLRLRGAQRSRGEEASGPPAPGHLLRPKPTPGPAEADPSARQCHSESMWMATVSRA